MCSCQRKEEATDIKGSKTFDIVKDSRNINLTSLLSGN